MAITQIPDVTVPMNVGFEESSPSPIIHSFKWRHLTSKTTFATVAEVINHHVANTLTIDIATHTASFLDIFFLKSANITSVNLSLRYVKKSNGILIEEPYTVGEKGATMQLVNDTVDNTLQVIKGISFTQKDLNNGTPMYDFMSMSEEGNYEIWAKAKTADGKELQVRIPFAWSNLDPSQGGGGEIDPTDPPEESDTERKAQDEYYVTIIEGDSPFTKRPSTHFRLAGIGMLKKPFCFKRFNTPPSPPISKPIDTPIIGDKPTVPCELTIVPTQVSKMVGEVVEFTLVHVNTSGIQDIVINTDEIILQNLGEGTLFTALRAGSSTVEFVVTYNDGQECIVTGNVTISEVPEPEPPDDEPVITHGYDLKFRLDWGYRPGRCDLDFYASVDGTDAGVGHGRTTKLEYTHSSGGKVYLDQDNTYHDSPTTSQPELITIENMTGHKISLGIVDYSKKGVADVSPVTVKIFDAETDTVLKTITVPGNTWAEHKIHVCDIEVKAPGATTTNDITVINREGKLF